MGSGGSELDEIAFLKQKAKDGKHWMLLSSTLLEEAKLELYNVSFFTYRSLWLMLIWIGGQHESCSGAYIAVDVP